jgi:hypothetical protein
VKDHRIAMESARRFLLILTDVRHPAANVEEFRLACRTLENVVPKEEKEFARSIGVSGYEVWKARKIALVACRALDALEGRGLELTKENFRMIIDEGSKAPQKGRIDDSPARMAALAASLVLTQVKPWSNCGSCRIPRNRKLPWRIRLAMAVPWVSGARARLRWMISRFRND